MISEAGNSGVEAVLRSPAAGFPPFAAAAAAAAAAAGQVDHTRVSYAIFRASPSFLRPRKGHLMCARPLSLPPLRGQFLIA